MALVGSVPALVCDNVATDAFGNVLGSSIAGQIGQGSQHAQALADAEYARWGGSGVGGGTSASYSALEGAQDLTREMNRGSWQQSAFATNDIGRDQVMAAFAGGLDTRFVGNDPSNGTQFADASDVLNLKPVGTSGSRFSDSELNAVAAQLNAPRSAETIAKAVWQSTLTESEEYSQFENGRLLGRYPAPAPISIAGLAEEFAQGYQSGYGDPRGMNRSVMDAPETTAESVGRFTGNTVDAFKNFGAGITGVRSMDEAQASWKAGNYGTSLLQGTRAFGEAGMTVFSFGLGSTTRYGTTMTAEEFAGIRTTYATDVNGISDVVGPYSRVRTDGIPSRLYHYTDEVGLNGIMDSQSIRPSLKAVNPNDVRYGDGQYFSNISPGSKSPAQLSKAFINNPFQGKRYSNFVEIDTIDLNIIKGREGVYVAPNQAPLNLTGRITDSGMVGK